MTMEKFGMTLEKFGMKMGKFGMKMRKLNDNEKDCLARSVSWELTRLSQ